MIKSLSYTIVFLFNVILLTGITALIFNSEAMSEEIFSKRQEDQIKKMALEAILENPDILVEVSRILKERNDQKKNENTSLLLRKYKKELFFEKDTEVLGNREGDITIVEFFDYNCSYCKVAAKNIRRLIEDDKNIRFIPREWPILNSVSVFASKAAIASIKQKKYKEFHWRLMDKKRLSEDSILDLASQLGIDLVQLASDMEGDFVKTHIEKSNFLAKEIGFSGTPLFIIEDQFIPGFVPINEIKKIISEIRKNR